MSALYNLVLIVASPLLALYLAYRVVVNGKSRGAWRQQLGFLPESLQRRASSKPRVWVHAVSVGEAVASSPVIRELRGLLPDADIVVSTTTTTGQTVAQKSIPEADHVIYFPFDLLPAVCRALRTVRPDVFVSVESEIWPNFLSAASAMGVRTMIVNGIVSDTTVAKGGRFRGIYRWSLSNVDRLLMQTKADADRIAALGADPSKVEIAGNCKFDQEKSALTEEQASDLRKLYGFTNGRRVFVAGSTNPGEDEPVLEAFAKAREAFPELALVIAPRQIERAESIAQMAGARGFSCGRRSAGALDGSEDVTILDTFGELGSVYGIGDVAFVGGSLIPKGGHNILQPIAQGKPVFYGPHMFKSRDLVAQAKAANVGFEVSDGSDLGSKIVKLLSDRAELEAIRGRAFEMMAANRGASRRCAEAIAEAAQSRI